MSATALFSIAFLDPNGEARTLNAVRVQNTETAAYTSLTEVVGNPGRWAKLLTWGSYNVEIQEDVGGDWEVVKEGVWHGTADAKTHAEGTTDKHDAGDVTYTPAVSADWPDPDPTTTEGGLDKLADRLTDVEAWDAEDIPFTPDVAGDWEDAPTDLGAAVNELGERVRDLEEGEATTPAGIDDFLDSLGVVVAWDAQDIHDIQYAIKFLWKHTTESAPAIGDLAHQRRTLAVEELIPYHSRRVDLSSSPDSNLILYYAIAARGRADTAWTWSSVESITVDLPEYTQEFRASLSGITLQCMGADGGTSELFEAVREPNQFPSADATPPTTNFFIVPACAHNYQYTEITLHAAVLPTADVTLVLRNDATGATKTFTIDSATGRILVANQSFLLEILSGAELQIYTLDAKDMGDVHLWLRRTLYTA